MTIRSIAGLMLCALITSPASAQQCMSEGEMSALMAYMAPPVLQTAAKTCAAAPGSTFLASPDAQALIGRYQQLAERSWPQTRAAMFKMMNGKSDDSAKVLSGLSDSAMRELLNAGFVAAVAGDIKVGDCAEIDRLARALSNISPEAATQLVTALAGLTGDQKFNVCKPG